jgi:rhodanese-related sulfurtransferase
LLVWLDLPELHSLREAVERLGRSPRAGSPGKGSSADFESARSERGASAAVPRSRSLAAALGVGPRRHLDDSLRRSENSAVPVERISKEQLKERLDRGDKPTILDVRLKYAYEHSTVKLPGAIRVPPYAIDSVAIPTGADIVAYDSDPNELVSTHVAAELLRKGLKVHVLKGGVPEWLAANFPIETKEAPRSAPPEPGSLSKG